MRQFLKTIVSAKDRNCQCCRVFVRVIFYISVVIFLIVTARFHKIQKHIIGDIAPGRLSGGLVKGERNPAIDAASLFFVRHRRKARIRARRAACAFLGMFKTNVVASEKQAENR
ncbi:hypothetical protein BH20ACI1_BH20ACI1_04150 [soil metagenome]